MRLYINQKVFSWRDKFYVKDEAGQDRYYIEGEVFSLGKKLHVYDMSGQEVAYIEQQLSFWLAEYALYQQGQQIALIKQQFSFLRPRYVIEGLDWEIEGSFWEHDYEIRCGGEPIVSICKEWMTWGDSYELTISDPAYEIIALAVVLTIDCVIDSRD